ncbi:MAG: hypothetical protein WDW38_001831 [Sanguina aurantia]
MKSFFGLGKQKPKDGITGLLGKSLMVGQHNVRVEALVGEGGYASIYKVVDNTSGAVFALKHVKMQAESDGESYAEVQQEAKAMEHLKGHPNILRLHAVAYAGAAGAVTDAYMLLEFCPITLHDVMQRFNQNLDDLLVFEVFSEVCRAVAHMHAQSPPITHRDLKVENILKNGEGRWVLADFGSVTTRAQAYETPAEIAAEEDLIRRTTTPAYRSPEMWDILITRGRLDSKSDIWALGVLLYVLCFGKLPFLTDSKLAVIYGRYEMPPSKRPAPLLQLIQRLLTCDSELRPDITAVLSMMDQASGSPGGGEVVTLQQRTPSSGRVSPPTQPNEQQQADPFSAFDSTTPPPAHLQTSRASASPPSPPPPTYYPPNPAQQQQQQQQQNLQLQQQQQKLQTLQQQHQLQQQQLQQQQQRAATQTLTKSGSDPVNRAHPTTNAPAYPGVPLATPATTARLPPTHLSPCLVSAPAAASSISHTDATATLIDVPETRRSLMDELPPQSYGSSSAYPAIHPPGSGNVGPGSGPAGDARSLFRADPLRASLQHYLHAEPSQAAAPTSSRPPPLLKMFSGFGNTGGFGDDAAWGADSSGFGAEDDAFPAQRAPSSSSSSSRFIPPDLLTTSAAAVDSSSGAQGPDAGPTKLTSRSPPPAAEPRPSMDHGAVSRPSQPLLTAASSQSLPHSLSRTPTPAAPASVSDQAGLVSSGRLDPAAAAAAAAMGAGSLPGVDRPSPAHGSSSSSTAPAVATATAGATEVLTQQRSAAAHSPLPLPPALASDSLLPAALAVRLVQQGSLSACPLPRSPVRSRGHTPSHSRSNSNAMDVFAELDIVGSSSSHSRALAAVPQPMVPSAFPPPGLQAAASADLQHASSLPAAPLQPLEHLLSLISCQKLPLLQLRPVAAAAGLLGITSADLNELTGSAVVTPASVAHVRSNNNEGVPPPPASVSSPPARLQAPIGDAGMGAVVHSSSGAVSREEGALREELNLVK